MNKVYIIFYEECNGDDDYDDRIVGVVGNLEDAEALIDQWSEEASRRGTYSYQEWEIF